MNAEKFVAFDTETTGLSPVGDRIVEIAAVAFGRDGSEMDVFEQLVEPGIPIPPELTGIHGITDEMVAGKPRIQQVLPEFLRFIDRAVLVAHNAPYDVSMLLVPLVRMSHTDGPATAGRADGAGGNLALDTCTLARAVFPGAPNYRLGTVAEMLGISRGRAHRAMPDVRTCKELFLRILSKLPPGVSIEELVRMNGSELRLGIDERMLASLPPSPSSPSSPPSPMLDPRAVLLLNAMRSSTPVMIEYQGGTKGSGPRLVTPITMMAHGTAASLIAQCHLDGGLKNFRLERISAVYPLPVS